MSRSFLNGASAAQGMAGIVQSQPEFWTLSDSRGKLRNARMQRGGPRPREAKRAREKRRCPDNRYEGDRGERVQRERGRWRSSARRRLCFGLGLQSGEYGHNSGSLLSSAPVRAGVRVGALKKAISQGALVKTPRIVPKPKETKRQSSSKKWQLLLRSTVTASKPDMLCAVVDVAIKLVLGGHNSSVYGYYHNTSAPDLSTASSLSNPVPQDDSNSDVWLPMRRFFELREASAQNWVVLARRIGGTKPITFYSQDDTIVPYTYLPDAAPTLPFAHGRTLLRATHVASRPYSLIPCMIKGSGLGTALKIQGRLSTTLGRKSLTGLDWAHRAPGLMVRLQGATLNCACVNYIKGHPLSYCQFACNFAGSAFGASSSGFGSLSSFGTCIRVSALSIQTACNLGKLVSQGAKGSALVLDCGAEDNVSSLFCNVYSYQKLVDAVYKL
ncbi:hypothetical protein V8E53_007628 [Lactarius tabidus]